MKKLAGLLLILLAFVSFFALISYTPFSPSINTMRMQQVSSFVYFLHSFADILLQCFGYAAFFIPFPLFFWGRHFFAAHYISFFSFRILAYVFSLFLLAVVFASLFSPYHGGLLGYFFSLWFALGSFVMVFFLFGLLFYIFSLGFSLAHYASFFAKCIAFLDFCIYHTQQFFDNVQYLFQRKAPLPDIADSPVRTSIRYPKHMGHGTDDIFAPDISEDASVSAHVLQHDRLLQDSPLLKDIQSYDHELLTPVPPTSGKSARPAASAVKKHDYTPPPLDLLKFNRTKASVIQSDLDAQAALLLLAIKEFGVKGTITRIQPGPVVTLFEFLPASGVKVSKIISLETDIARKMEALSVRIAPIAGRNVVGIEIPTPVRQSVYFRTLLHHTTFTQTTAVLPIALGEDISGTPTVVDLATMPHLLIAGTTGSGKSVAVNTMILSLLYGLSPDQCRLIMIDPKMLELSVYQNIPHLLTPVVTDSEKALTALKWAVKEMENRYRLMSQLSVRNIAGYNEKIRNAPEPLTITQMVAVGIDGDGHPLTEPTQIPVHPLPFIVVIIDEVADLMMVAGKEVEWAVQRLAQMARAAGIHVIMATQRPSVDVITGTIKANFPARISFQVSSKIDSRTILGEQGAEQLLGKGDMLYMPGVGRLQRLHGAFVSDMEVESVVAFLKERYPPQYVENIFQGLDASADSPLASASKDVDPLYAQALALIRSEGKVSTSFIQRHFQIGYNRAARIVESMEDNGVITKANAVGKRDVL